MNALEPEVWKRLTEILAGLLHLPPSRGGPRRAPARPDRRIAQRKR